MRVIRLLCLFIVTSVLIGCATDRKRMDEAQYDFVQQEYYSALKKVLPLAYRGNPEAQYAVGYMYYFGQGVQENDVLAKQWFRLAAMQKHVKAQRALQMIAHKERALKKQPTIL